MISISQTQTGLPPFFQDSNVIILTAEGDRVTLSRGSDVRADLSTDTAQGFREGQRIDVRRQRSEVSSESGFTLQVNGDLSEQEKTDIQQFLKSAESILKEFLEGNVEPSSNALGNLSILTSLTAAEVSFDAVNNREHSTATYAVVGPTGNESGHPTVPSILAGEAGGHSFDS